MAYVATSSTKTQMRLVIALGVGCRVFRLVCILHPGAPCATLGTVASATIRHIGRGYPAGMSKQEIQHLINCAIREHELRVALWSGLAGALLMAGTWHAIWLCR